MDANKLNIVLGRIKETCLQVLGEELIITNTSLYNNDSEYNGHLIAIGITGDLRGQVVLNVSHDLCFSIGSKMFGSQLDSSEIALSAVSELMNMSMGNVSTGLSEAGFSTDITPPVMYSGEKVSIHIMEKRTLEIKMNNDSCLIMNLQ